MFYSKCLHRRLFLNASQMFLVQSISEGSLCSLSQTAFLLPSSPLLTVYSCLWLVALSLWDCICVRVRGLPFETRQYQAEVSSLHQKLLQTGVQFCVVQRGLWMRVRGDQLVYAEDKRKKSLNSGSQCPKENSAHVRH